MRDGYVAANSAAVANAAFPAMSTASLLPRSSSTAVMLSAHCSKVGSAPGCDRIGGSRARLVEEDQPPQRRHRLDPPLNGWQLRQVLAAGEPCSGRTLCLAHPQRKRGRRRASPRSAHSASPRTLQKSKSRESASTDVYAVQRRSPEMFFSSYGTRCVGLGHNASRGRGRGWVSPRRRRDAIRRARP